MIKQFFQFCLFVILLGAVYYYIGERVVNINASDVDAFQKAYACCQVREPIASVPNIWNLIWSAIFIAIVLLVIVLFLSQSLYHKKKNEWTHFWHHIGHNLTGLFIVTWLFGFVVYTVGMFIGLEGKLPEDVLLRLLAVAPMAAIHAFGMFVMSSDVSEVQEAFHRSVFYMFLFSLSHFFAALVSMAFVIKYFGYSIVSGLRLWHTTIFGRFFHRDELYVFWGTNEPSFTLASDIKDKKEKSKDTQFRIAFVRTADNNDQISERTGFDRLFSFLSLKNQELEKFKELECLTMSAFSRLSKLDLTEDANKDESCTDILCDKLDLHRLAQLVKMTKQHVHVFMLGEDEESNIKAASNLSKDKHIQSYSEDGKKVTIYCHARYDSVKRVVEHQMFGQNLSIKVVDSAHLAIEQLKAECKELCAPVHYVEIDKDDATVSGDFRSMVIGMGQCGRDAINYLYEYGAFAGKYLERSSFRCDVFDKHMDEIGPRYKAQRPAASISNVNHELTSYSLVNLYHSDITENLFWKYVDEHIAQQNMIFITIHDDEIGMSLAVNLLKQAIKKGANMSKFRIFVRSYRNDILPHMQEIAKYYNHSVGCKDNPEPIYIFGKQDDIYTWECIVKNSLQRDAFSFYNCYEGIAEDDEHLGDAWMARRNRELSKDRTFMASVNSLRRREMQDMENAFHRKTKLYMIRKVWGEEKLAEIAGMISDGLLHRRVYDEAGNVQMLWDKEEPGVKYRQSIVTNIPGEELSDIHNTQIVLTTLAKVEHLRWNASHEMLGYVHGDNTNEMLMQHECLTSWEKINHNYIRGYDYGVVDTSLILYYKEIIPN